MDRSLIPEELLQDMLYRARVARSRVEHGLVKHRGIDVAELAEYWAHRLFAIARDQDDEPLTEPERAQLRAVLVEATEYMALDPDGSPDPEFVPVTEALLSFLEPVDAWVR